MAQEPDVACLVERPMDRSALSPPRRSAALPARTLGLALGLCLAPMVASAQEAPSGYPPPSGYPQGQPYPAPPAAYPVQAPVVIPAVPVTLTPPGVAPAPPAIVYTEPRVRWGLVGAGLGTLGGMYFFTALSAAILDSRTTSMLSTAAPTNNWPLYVPVAGPFIAMAYPHSAIERFGLAFDGLAQTAGLAMLIAGVVHKKQVQVYRHHLSLLPAPSPGGLALLGSF